jgi:hypothetical protein
MAAEWREAMTREAVKSTQIKSIGHDGSALEVEFSNGAVYRYPGVPAHIHQQMIGAESVGKFFGKHIKGAYPFTKVN